MEVGSDPADLYFAPELGRYSQDDITFPPIDLCIEVLEETAQAAVGIVRTPWFYLVYLKGQPEVLFKKVGGCRYPFSDLEVTGRSMTEFLVQGDLQFNGSRLAGVGPRGEKREGKSEKKQSDQSPRLGESRRHREFLASTQQDSCQLARLEGYAATACWRGVLRPAIGESAGPLCKLALRR